MARIGLTARGEGVFGGEALDELQILVGGLAADVAGLGFFQENLPVLGGGLEIFPALHGVRDAAPAEAAAAFEDDADLVLDVFALFLPTDVLAHDEGTVA